MSILTIIGIILILFSLIVFGYYYVKHIQELSDEEDTDYNDREDDHF